VIRRLALAAGTVLLVVTLGACSTVTRNDAAAEVGDTELARDDFHAMLDSDLTGQLLGSSARGGLVEGDTARGLLGAWILLTAIEQDGLLAGADRAAVEASLAEQFGELWTSAPASLRDLVVTNAIVTDGINQGTLTQDQAVEALNSVTVFVDSRYGTWQPATVSVDPLG